MLDAATAATAGQAFSLQLAPGRVSPPRRRFLVGAEAVQVPRAWDTPESRELWQAWFDWCDGKGPRPVVEPWRAPWPRRKGPTRAELIATALAHADGPVAGLILTGRQTVKACTPQSELVRCGCRWRKVQSCCMDRDCRTCVSEVGRRRAKRVLQRLKDGLPEADHPVGYTVLTVPPAVRVRFADPKAWQKLARKAWRILKKEFGGVFGVEATHPVGDAGERLHRDAGEDSESVFHPHLNFLWVRSTYWGQIDLDLLRRRWAEVLGLGDGEAVSVYHGFRHDGGKLAHTVRYATRSFPGWGFWLPSMRWYGKYPKRPPTAKVICEHCGQEFRCVARGALADQLADKWTLAGLPAGDRVRGGRAPPWGDS